ncbi:MAG: leucine-rich repeat protein [Bacteroidales bacterium]|nr:leucine-rich repeat protein [Bacteroidales bacterium]
MKKVLLLAALMIAAMSGWCYDFDFSKVSPSGQNLYYKIVDGNAMVTYPNRSGSNYYYFITRPTGALVIPDTVSYNGTVYNVTSISSYAFMGCKGLTSVTIPDAVTSIGTYAFAGCELDSLTIGQGLTTISNHAFDNDTISYLNYNCPANVTERITKSRLATVIIGDNVTSIRNNAFRVCWDLTSVTIGNSVTSIGDEAFYNCSGLTSVIIPNSVTSIGYKAFQKCYNLTSVTIGNSVTSIGKYAFSECSGLTSITIPNSVTSIFNYAFSSCSGLTSIIIPDSVNRIDGLAFYCCTGLTSVVFKAKKCTNSGSCDGNREPVFGGCSNITSFEFDSNIQVIPSFICHGLSNITNVTIPDSVNSIRDHAFTNCTGLTSIIIPEGVTSIGDNAFANCTGLDSVNMLPATAPLLGYNSFYNNASGRVFILNGCSSFVSYDSSWVAYRSALRDPIINIDVTVFANDTVRGAANVLKDRSNHDVRCDSTAVISATANYGYHFDHWSNGRTANPDTITLEGDSTVTALFERNTYHLTARVNDATLGSVAMPQGDSALYQDTLMVVATPAAHHHVASWQGQDIVAVSEDKDTVWVRMTDNRNITCNFALDTYTVTVSVNDPAMGTATVNGTTTATVMSGTEVTLQATANSGYRFVRWNDNDTHAVRTVTVTSNMSFTATFESLTAIDDVRGDMVDVKVYAEDSRIVVVDAPCDAVSVFDITGRLVEQRTNDGERRVVAVPATGMYFVKVGTLPMKKVIVVR